MPTIPAGIIAADNLTYLFLLQRRFFTTKRFASLRRQLSWYKFSRIRRGPDKGSFFNEYFLRGRPDLTLEIQRTPQSCKTFLDAVQPPANFFQLPFCIRLTDEELDWLSSKAQNRAPSVNSILPDHATAAHVARSTNPDQFKL